MIESTNGNAGKIYEFGCFPLGSCQTSRPLRTDEIHLKPKEFDSARSRQKRRHLEDNDELCRRCVPSRVVVEAELTISPEETEIQPAPCFSRLAVAGAPDQILTIFSTSGPSLSLDRSPDNHLSRDRGFRSR